MLVSTPESGLLLMQWITFKKSLSLKKRYFQILESFQSFVCSKTIAGRLPEKVNVIKRRLLYLALLLQETLTPVFHFSALLDNVIILMKGIHRNIMKNYLIVQ